MKNYKIALIPGDGIGKEVMDEAKKVLIKLSKLSENIRFEFFEYEWGCEYYLKTGKMMPEDGLKDIEDKDAILLGAVGFPNVADHISLRELLLKIRQEFDQYINLRPVTLLKEEFCPIKGKKIEDIDMVFVRENVEGEYCGSGGIQYENTDFELAVQNSVFTRRNTKRVMDYAFELAKKRKKHLTSVTKSNALNYSMVFWDKIFQETSIENREIYTQSYHVDAMAMYMIQKPEEFDVIVASNLFGDILTDLGATLQGGLGFAAGANINPEKRYPSMFEPVHGSAPTIAGKNISNPIAMIWTVKLMLEHLELNDFADLILKSIKDVLDYKQSLTPDLGGNGTTSGVGYMICSMLEKHFLEKELENKN